MHGKKLLKQNAPKTEVRVAMASRRAVAISGSVSDRPTNKGRSLREMAEVKNRRTSEEHIATMGLSERLRSSPRGFEQPDTLMERAKARIKLPPLKDGHIARRRLSERLSALTMYLGELDTTESPRGEPHMLGVIPGGDVPAGPNMRKRLSLQTEAQYKFLAQEAARKIDSENMQKAAEATDEMLAKVPEGRKRRRAPRRGSSCTEAVDAASQVYFPPVPPQASKDSTTSGFEVSPRSSPAKRAVAAVPDGKGHAVASPQPPATQSPVRGERHVPRTRMSVVNDAIQAHKSVQVAKKIDVLVLS